MGWYLYLLEVSQYVFEGLEKVEVVLVSTVQHYPGSHFLG